MKIVTPAITRITKRMASIWAGSRRSEANTAWMVGEPAARAGRQGSAGSRISAISPGPSGGRSRRSEPFERVELRHDREAQAGPARDSIGSAPEAVRRTLDLAVRQARPAVPDAEHDDVALLGIADPVP